MNKEEELSEKIKIILTDLDLSRVKSNLEKLLKTNNSFIDNQGRGFKYKKIKLDDEKIYLKFIKIDTQKEIEISIYRLVSRLERGSSKLIETSKRKRIFL